MAAADRGGTKYGSEVHYFSLSPLKVQEEHYAK